MKRPKLFRWLAWAMAWMVGACGNTSAPPPQPSPDEVDPSGQTVVFWYQHTRERETALQEMIAQFNQQNPYGIQVKGEYAGTYSHIYNKMLVGLQGGSLPQLVVAYQNQAQVYHSADGVMDLLPYMNSAKWGLSSEARADYIESFIEQDRMRGIQMAFPPNRSMEILFYNADWLRELGSDHPPKTWEEFARLCRQAKAQPFSKAANSQRSVGYLLDVDASRLASMVFSRGGDFIDPAQTAYNFNQPETRAALQELVELEKDGSVEVLTETNGDTKEFGSGQLLFAIGSSSGLPFYKKAVNSGAKFTWGVAAVPYEGEHPVVNVYGASVALCRTTPEQQLAAWLFLKWFTEPDQQARWVRASGYFPARRSTAAGLEAYFAENPNFQVAYGLLDYGKIEPTAPGYETVRRLIQNAMVDAMDGVQLDPLLNRLTKAANATLEPE
ncbi:MAG: ABC transporter substrate-binding protein [Candidatus Latescibacteria bacterium]|nr:ABC transporter substrate-binding protein [Candidatus Latescibacterota bacterium]